MATLKFDLDVIGSTCIRRRKPWPQLTIVGESVFLLDNRRISVLYMTSGKTKRKITKIQPLLKHVICMGPSSHGDFIGGLLDSGDLFLWHKTTDMLKNIPGLPLLVNPVSAAQGSGGSQLPYLCIAGSGSLILVVTENLQIFLWELDSNGTLFTPKQPNVPGTWTQVLPEKGSLMPSSANLDLSVHAVFSINNATLGLHCLCSFVFLNDGELCVSTAIMQWSSEEPVLTTRSPTFSVKWKTMMLQTSVFGPLVQPVMEQGAVVARNSGDGQLLAIAVNQLNTQANRMAFVSVLTEVVTVVDLKAMGTKFPITKNSRSYWIVKMEWSHDDLFLVCITGQGSVCLLPRLGEPVLIQTHGFNVDMGPKYFLPLHPLISVEYENESTSSKPPQKSNPMRQRFSVATHPTLSLFLFSDGFMVTAVEMAQDVTCLTMLRQIASLSSSHLDYVRNQRKLHLTLFEALKSTKSQAVSSPGFRWKTGKRRGLRASVSSRRRSPYKFEEAPPDALDETTELEHVFGGTDLLEAGGNGRIVFGDAENVSESADFKNLMDEEGLTADDYMMLLQKELVLAWGLAASHIGHWTIEHEEVLTSIMHGLVKMSAVLLETGKTAGTDQKTSAELTRVLSFFKQISGLLCLDALAKNLLICYIRFVHSTVELLLRTKVLKRSRVHALNGCYLLLRYAEQHLEKVYSSVADGAGVVQVLSSLPGGRGDRQLKNSLPEDTAENVPGTTVAESGTAQDFENRTSSRNSSMPCKRLAGSWRLLYKYVTKHYDFIRHHYEAQSRPRKSLCVQLKLTTEVMLAVICRMQKLNIDSPFRISPSLLPAELSYIEGQESQAIKSWIQNILGRSAGEDVLMDRCLHAILYALLLGGNLRGAMELVELLVRQPNVSRAIRLYAKNDQAKTSALSTLPKSGERQSTFVLPRLLMESSAVRHLMRSLGRVMAAYFTNMTLFVFPPHHPCPIPPIHSTKLIESRVLVLKRDSVTRDITSDQLDSAWTSQKALQYLLLSGQMSDAVWTVHGLGDWKTAFYLSTAICHHRNSVANDFTRVKLILPNSLLPEAILRNHVMSIFKELARKEDLKLDAASLAQSLTDTLTAASVAGVDLTCVMLKFLVQSLRDVMQHLGPIIPNGVYLPAPPVYCPQPVITEEERVRLSSVDLEELRLRRRVSVIVNLVVLVLCSSHVARPSVQWYAAKVLKAISLQMKVQGGPEEIDSELSLQRYASSKSMFSRSEETPSVQLVLSCLRDVSSLLWMMEVRERLSLLLRKKMIETQKCLLDSSSVQNGTLRSLRQEALQWAIHLLPFRQMLNAERQIHQTVLSLILEMPTSADTARILARHFPHAEDLDGEVQDKLQRILKDWQGIFLSSSEASTGMTMNLVYCEEVADCGRNLERKRALFHEYDELVFNGRQSGLSIGSRPFESSVGYARFLEMFYDVCLGKAVDKASISKQRTPLLVEFSADVRRRELNALPKKVVSGLSEEVISVKNSLSSCQHPLPAKRKLNGVKLLVEISKSRPQRVGLFRSLSTGDVAGGTEGNLIRSSSVSSFRSTLNESESPMELDVLLPAGTAGNSGSLRRKAPRPLPVNRNNNSSNPKPIGRDVKRATSLIERTPSSTETDPLSQPLVPSWILERMKFDSSFGELERLVDWLSLWAGRSNAFSDGALLWLPDSDSRRPLMQVRVTPKLLTYSLWLIDNSGQVQVKSLDVENEVTVAMVQEVEASPRRDSRTGTVKSDEKRSLPDRKMEKSFSEKRKMENPVSEIGRFNASPLRRSRSFPAEPLSDKRIKNMKQDSQDDEFERVAAANATIQIVQNEKKKERKKRKKSLMEEDDPNNKIFDRDSEQTVISYDTEIDDLEARRLSLEDQVEAHLVQENLLSPDGARTDTESSLAVSSLTGDELQQTMKQTLISLTEKKTFAEKETGMDDDSEERMEVRNVPQQQSSAPPEPQMDHRVDPQPDLTFDLQRVIREEMRRIMAAQQRGILAMLNSLEQTDDLSRIPGIPQMNSSQMMNTPRMMSGSQMMNGHAHAVPSGIGFRHPTLVPQTFSVYTVHADTPSVQKSDSPGPIGESKTPIFDNLKRDEWKEESPLKVSDLTKTSHEKNRHNPQVQDALWELHTLRNQQNVRPFLVAPAPYGSGTSGKTHPFSNAMEALRDFNGRMFPFLGAPPPSGGSLLLRLPLPENQFPVKLPILQNTELKEREMLKVKRISHNPPLQRNYFIHEPPDRDTGGASIVPPPAVAWNTRPFSVPFFLAGLPSAPVAEVHRLPAPVLRGAFPFPLLRLPNMTHGGVRPAFSFPPRQGFDLEKERLPPNEESVKEHVENSTSNLDVQQPDETDSEKRDRKKESPSKADDVQKSSSDMTKGQNSDVEVKEPVKLHSGYALTPGLFDEYLGKENDLGSVVDTNARVQYDAVMALKSKPKKEAVLTKDMYTETNEAEMQGTDIVGEVVRKYYEDSRGHLSGPLLPPDVFERLRFPDKGRIDGHQARPESQELERMHNYINVVDINAGMLSDIMSSVRDKQAKAVAPSEESSHEPPDVTKARVMFKDAPESAALPGHDKVTFDLFQRKTTPSDVMLSPGKLRNHGKPLIEEMNKRMNEIEKMAQNMQRDFDGTRLVISKLEEVGDRVVDARQAKKKQDDSSRLLKDQRGPVDETDNDVTMDSLTQGQLTHRSAQALLERALETADVGAEVSRDDLHELFEALSPRRSKLEVEKETDDNRRKLLEWMEKKRMEQMRQYKHQLEEKRGSEPHPYQLKRSQKTLSWKQFEEDRLAKKKKMHLQNMELRNQEAAGLLTEMLSDQPSLSRPTIDQSVVPADTTLSFYRPTGFETSRSGKGAPRSLSRKQKFPTDNFNEYLMLLRSCEREAELILKGEDRDDRTARSEVEQRQKRKKVSDGDANDKENVNSSNRTYRPKSFQEVVKLQRPEVTRHNRPRLVQSSSSLRDNRPATDRPQEISLEEKQKIYGSTHLPGSSRRGAPSVRTVKTYTQRLQDMKQGPSGGQIQWRYQIGALKTQPDSVRSELQGAQRRRPRPRRTLTYSQQLKQLQPPKDQYSTNSGFSVSKPTPGLRWHKPLHRSLTYAEQLQKLQKPATVRLEKMRPSTTQRWPFERSIQRSQIRSRPYADPYSDLEASTDVSAWSMDDEVQKILYGDSNSQLAASDTDLSELIALRDRETPIEYTDMVQVEDLEMIESVSIASCLDWEEIDRLVAEIN